MNAHTKSHKTGGVFAISICCLILANAWTISPAFADTLLFRLNMQEYSSPSRAGTLDFIQPDALPSTLPDPGLTSFFPGIWLEAWWEKICVGNSIVMSGGTADGWLLGPVTGPEVNNFYNQFFDRDASMVFIVFIGSFFGPPIDGAGTRDHCSGSVTPVVFGQIFLFLLDEPIGNHVADLFYFTDLSPGGEWYEVTR